MSYNLPVICAFERQILHRTSLSEIPNVSPERQKQKQKKDENVAIRLAKRMIYRIMQGNGMSTDMSVL